MQKAFYSISFSPASGGPSLRLCEAPAAKGEEMIKPIVFVVSENFRNPFLETGERGGKKKGKNG
jgi:hypothetical protein